MSAARTYFPRTGRGARVGIESQGAAHKAKRKVRFKLRDVVWYQQASGRYPAEIKRIGGNGSFRVTIFGSTHPDSAEGEQLERMDQKSEKFQIYKDELAKLARKSANMVAKRAFEELNVKFPTPTVDTLFGLPSQDPEHLKLEIVKLPPGKKTAMQKNMQDATKCRDSVKASKKRARTGDDTSCDDRVEDLSDLPTSNDEDHRSRKRQVKRASPGQSKDAIGPAFADPKFQVKALESQAGEGKREHHLGEKPMGEIQDISSDDEDFMSDVRIADAVLAFSETDKKYVPARIISHQLGIFSVRTFDGSNIKGLKRSQIKIIGDSDFGSVPMAAHETPQPTADYRNPVLETRVLSVFPALDEIMRDSRPSWRKKTLGDKGRRADHGLAREVGGNPYSVDEYDLIKRMVFARYLSTEVVLDDDVRFGDDEGHRLSRRSSRRRADHFREVQAFPTPALDESEIFAHGPKDVRTDDIRVVRLVLLPECITRMLVMTNLPGEIAKIQQHSTSCDLSSSDDESIASSSNGGGSLERRLPGAGVSPFLMDFVAQFHYNSEKWNDPDLDIRREEGVFKYLLSADEEASLLEKAEVLLRESHWMAGLFELRNASQKGPLATTSA